jgi:hypothetical protein
MSDDTIRTLERAVTSRPDDACAWDRLDGELSRLGRPTHRVGRLASLASALFEAGLARDPWKMIRTPCCGRAPRWAPPTFHGDFRIGHAAHCPPVNRYDDLTSRHPRAVRPRCGTRFLLVELRPSLTMPPETIAAERVEGDWTPGYISPRCTSVVRTILRELPVYFERGQSMRVMA